MKISILGCGWLGLPLGKHLSSLGHQVKGSTTRSEKLDIIQATGIMPYLIDLDPHFQGDASFFEGDILILNIPPRNREGQPDFHEAQLCSIRDQVKKRQISNLLFISSTGVYPNLNREVTESDADPDSISRGGVPLLKMEKLFTETTNFKTTVIRFGGLYGPDRHPGRFLAGKTGLKGADNPVNMIHLEDCIGVIQAIIEQGVWGETFNACSPNHPSRKEFYEQAAREMGLDLPVFSEEDSDYKEVSVIKLQSTVRYKFRH